LTLDVCICTHNPIPETFQIVLAALANQTLARAAYQVWIIDNASDPALTIADLHLLVRSGVTVQLIRETQLGLSHARFRACAATTGDLVIFVDDDNELAPNYLETALQIAAEHPEIGCFGGKLLLAPGLKCPPWVEPLLGFLAIKDLGPQVMSGCLPDWQVWEPPGAGVIVQRSVLDRYTERLNNLPQAFNLDRKGRHGLLSCGDSLMMKGAYELGLQCSYQPRLGLNHHLPIGRFKFSYLIRLMFGYGRSNVRLDYILNRTVTYPTLGAIFTKMLENCRNQSFRSLRQALCLIALDLGQYYERQIPTRRFKPDRQLIS
jgi:glycosyltransferase involved in cell wall biosynthesis